MTGGFATIAGTVLGAYINFGIDAAKLIAASVMAAPAALAEYIAVEGSFLYNIGDGNARKCLLHKRHLSQTPHEWQSVDCDTGLLPSVNWWHRL